MPAISGLLSRTIRAAASSPRRWRLWSIRFDSRIAVSARTTLEGLTQLAPTTIVRIAINGWQHATYRLGYS